MPASIPTVRLSTRYGLAGIFVGLLAPIAMLLYDIVVRPAHDPTWAFAVLAAGGLLVFPLVGRAIGRRDEILLAQNRELATLSEQMRALSTIDALTGINNRRNFDERLGVEMARARRHCIPCSLVMIDLDRFKVANDRHGHQAGDEILRHVAAILTEEKRAGDLVARYGGEELVAILTHTDAANARRWAERVRARIEAEPTLVQGRAIPMTASFGVAAASPLGTTPAELIEAADRALYAAKNQGRNTIVVAGDAELAPEICSGVPR